MGSNFPTSLDALTNPTPTNTLATIGVEHDIEHDDANDAIEALEAKVGINSSAVTTSLDYHMNNASIHSSGGRELGYAESTADYSATTAGLTDVSGITTTVTVGSRPIIVEIGGPHMRISSGAGSFGLYIIQGTSTITTYCVSSSTSYVPFSARTRLSLAAGSYTFKAQGVTTGSAVGELHSLAVPALATCWIQVTEV